MNEPAEPAARGGGVALCLPLAEEQRLDAGARRHGVRVVARCSGASELAARIPALRPDAVVTVAQPQYLDAALVAACDDHGVRLIVVALSREEQRLAAELGVIDTLAEPFEWDAPAASPPPAAESEPAALDTAAAPVRGEVIAVWGPAGAPGRTSLAVALAAELASRGGVVGLADADTHAAAIAPSLGLLDEAPGFAAACRLAGNGALTRDEFDRVAEWVPLSRGGMSVLTGLGRASRWPELTAERVTATIAAARSWVSTLVLDTASSLEHDEEISSDLNAPRRNAAALATVRAADRVLLVGAADAIGLTRLVRAHLELIDHVPPERVTVVVNKVRSGAIGVNPEAQIRQSLARFAGIDDPVLIPWDPRGFDAALLSGRPLGEAAPRSAARVALGALIDERILVPAAARPGRRGFFTRERRLA